MEVSKKSAVVMSFVGNNSKRSPMLLAIDIGNSNTVFGVFDHGKLIRSWRLSSEKDRTVDEYGVLLSNLFALEKLEASRVIGVIVASVVPPLDWKIAEMIRSYFSLDAIFVTPENAGIPIRYDDPVEVGADRLMDAVAVIEYYRVPAVVVDLGTATTFNAITSAGEYMGGLIAPGIELSASTLVERAAKLPRIDISKPNKLIGQSTAASMQSGFFWGYISMMDGIIERMKKELGEDTFVIGTGGMANVIQSESRYVSEVDQNLTLNGLFLVAKKIGIV